MRVTAVSLLYNVTIGTAATVLGNHCCGQEIQPDALYDARHGCLPNILHAQQALLRQLLV
jgi:hypothetical protein